MRLTWVFSCFMMLLSSAKGQSSNNCIGTIENLALREQFVPSYNAPRTYELCPGARYQLGTIDFSYRVVGQGFIPLRSNLHIKCGADGSPDNNCVVHGGDVLLDGTSFYGITQDSVENVVIEGVTFENAGKHVAWINKRGSITFKDCVFRDNNRSTTPLFFDFYNPKGPAESLQVRFVGCTFSNNVYSGSPAHPAVVVGNGQQNHLAFDRAKFSGNNMVINNSRSSRSSFLVESSGPITMVNSCFENNIIDVAPVVHYGRDHVYQNNFAGSNTRGGACFFAARFESLRQLDIFAPACESFDSTVCRADETSMPSSTPSAVPTAPTTSPSASPTLSAAPSVSQAPTISAAPTMDPASPTMFPTTASNIALDSSPTGAAGLDGGDDSSALQQAPAVGMTLLVVSSLAWIVMF